MGLVFDFSLNGNEHAVTVDARQPVLRLNVDGQTHQVSEAASQSDPSVLLNVDGRSYQVWRCWEGDRLHLKVGGRSFSVGYEDAITAAQHHAGGDDLLRADMPGVVVTINCECGGRVASGDILMVIESMKMQINIVAPRDGVIESIHLEPNQTFEKGSELIALEREED